MTPSRLHPVEHFVETLLQKWSDEEALYTRRGQTELAAMMASIAGEIQSESDRFLGEALTLQEAADLSGCSYSTIESHLRAGKLSNAGEKGRPRV